MSETNVGSDHCRVVPVYDDADISQRIQFLRHLLAYSASAKQIAPQARVLEIGSGEGYGANYLASYCPDIIATDLSLQALSHAAECYPNVRYCQTLGSSLPFVSNAFDVVISFQVIEHIADAAVYAQEVHRVLKPQGQFILTTPNRRWRLLPFQKPTNPYHVREYSERELRRFLHQFFDQVQLYGVMASLGVMKMVRVKRNPIRVYGAMLKKLLGVVLPVSLLRPLKMPVRISTQTSPYASAPLASPGSIELSDFFLSANAGNGMDLFAIANKSE